MCEKDGADLNPVEQPEESRSVTAGEIPVSSLSISCDKFNATSPAVDCQVFHSHPCSFVLQRGSSFPDFPDFKDKEPCLYRRVIFKVDARKSLIKELIYAGGHADERDVRL